jgi:integrase
MPKPTPRDRGDGALFQESGSGRWVGRITVDGKRHKVTATTEAGARKKLRQLRTEIAKGQPVAPGNLTVAALLDEWQAKALPNSNLAPSTLTSHRWACKVITAELGRHRLQTLTPNHVEDMLERRAAAGASRATVHKIRQTFSKALAWSERRGIIGRNVARLAELPATARKAEPGRTMTPDQAARFIAAAPDATPAGLMFVVMILTGLRPGEAAALCWDDVELDDGVIHVHASVRRLDNGALELGPTKTAHSVRSLGVGPQVVDALRQQRKRQAEARLLAGGLWNTDHDLVFSTPIGTPLDSKAINRELRRVVAAAGLDADWSAVDLRHTAASLMSNSGVPIEVVADQLGHRDTRMVSIHYRHRVRRTVDASRTLDTVLHTAGGES